MNHIDEVKARINAFIDKTFDELRETLRHEKPSASTLGVSFSPSLVRKYVPSIEIVKPGLYVSNDAKIHVEVLLQDAATGLIHLELYDEEDPYKRFDFISTGMFLKFFKPSTPLIYVGGNAQPE